MKYKLFLLLLVFLSPMKSFADSHPLVLQSMDGSSVFTIFNGMSSYTKDGKSIVCSVDYTEFEGLDDNAKPVHVWTEGCKGGYAVGIKYFIETNELFGFVFKGGKFIFSGPVEIKD